MKAKLYILTLLALLTGGLCLALPSVRHVASKLFSSAVPTFHFAELRKTPTANAKGREASSITITPLDCATLAAPDLQLQIPADNYTCKVRVSWYLAPEDRVADSTLVRARGSATFDITPSSRRGDVIPERGELIDELSPLLASNNYRYLLQSRQAAGSFIAVFTARVTVLDHVDSALDGSVLSEVCSIGAIETSSAPLKSTSPGRWTGLETTGRKFPGTSYDFDFLEATPTRRQQVRATWYTFDNQNHPIWLQTQWMNTHQDSFGAVFSGELRRYRWNPSVSLRTGGKRVGTIQGIFLPPSQGVSARIKVRRIWNELGVTDGPLNDEECLVKNNYPFQSAVGKSAAINDSYSGVWSLRGDDPNSEADSVVFDGLGEYHMLRIWDQSGMPLWVHAASTPPAGSTTFNNISTLNVNYVMSPFVGGLPRYENGEAVCGHSGCLQCQVPVGNMTRWHNMVLDPNEPPLPHFYARYKLNLQAVPNLPAPAICGTSAGNPGISWERPRHTNIEDLDIVDGYSRFERGEMQYAKLANVVASPMEIVKPHINTPTQFDVSWALYGSGNYRLMRSANSINKVVADNIFLVGTFSDANRGANGLATPFDAGSYIYYVQRLNAGVYTTVATAAQVYITNPAPPPRPPQCLNILPGTLASTSTITSCVAPALPRPDILVKANESLVAIFPNTGTDYLISEEFVQNGVPAATGCHPTPTGPQQTPGLVRYQFFACPTPGEYLYRVIACSQISGCGSGFPTEGIRVLVGGAQTLAAPTNVNAIAQGSALGYSVSWTAPASTQALTYTIARKALGTAPAATQTPAPPSGAAEQTTTASTITGTETQNGTYYFWVKACAGALCSQWSQPSSGLVLPVVVAVVLPLSEPAIARAAGVQLTPAQILASDSVGGSSGAFSVNESGHATYSLPILVSPGAGSMAPSVSLNYSSGETSDGYLGVGWSIGAGSGISRCRKTFESGDFAMSADAASYVGSEPFDFSPNGAVCLDGQRLLKQSSTSCPSFAARSAIAEYRTEVDSFVQVCEYSDAAGAYAKSFFRSRGKDGAIKLYGYNPEASGDNDSHNSRSYFNNGEVMSWMISRQTDVVGNYIAYDYEKTCFDPNQAGCIGHVTSGAEIALKALRYTGSATQPTFATITFDYEARTTPVQHWLAGQKTQMSRRLLAVRSTDNNVELRKYILSYQEPSNLVSSGRKRIERIQECRGTACYRPVDFGWTVASNTAATTPSSQSNNQAGADFQNLMSKRFGDINGDGVTDMVWFSGAPSAQTIQIVPGVMTGTVYSLGFKYGGGINLADVEQRKSERWSLLDFNNDGRDDIIVLQKVGTLWQWEIHLNTGSSFSATALAGINLPAIDKNDSVVVQDVNGDGLVDILSTGPSLIPGNPQRTLYVSFASQSGLASGTPLQLSTRYLANFTNVPSGLGLALGHEGMLREHVPLDMNADGRADIRVALLKDVPNPDPNVNPCPATQRVTETTAVINELGEPAFYQCVDHGYFSYRGKAAAPNEVDFQFVTALGQPIYRVESNPKARPVTYGDINSDGYTDLMLSTGTVGQWQIFINEGGSLIKRGLVTLPYRLPGSTANITTEDLQVTLMDMNSDGNADITFRKQYACPRGCANGRADRFIIAVIPALQSGDGFDLSGEFDLGAWSDRVGNGDVYLNEYIDLDSDGRIDILQLKLEDRDNEKGWIVFQNTVKNIPADVITSITTGLGARTDITYKPMTDRSVYQRGTRVDPTGYGRGSAVLDVYAPMYVVAEAKSDAPTAANSLGKATVNYFYRAARAQGGGRGMLGFAEVRSCDLSDGMVVATEYEQKFPLVGIAKRTRSYVYGGSLLQSGTVNMPASFCNVTLESSSSFKLTSDGSENWKSLPATLSAGSAAPIFVYQEWMEQTESVVGSRDDNMDLFAPKKISRTLSTNIYQGAAHPAGDPRRSNLLGTVVSAYSCLSGNCTTLISQTQTTNSYSDDSDSSWLSAWLPGRLSSTSVRRCRGSDAANCASAATGTDTTNLRQVSYSYYGPTTSWPGMLRTETVRANGDASQRLTTAHVYDLRGNETLSASCSSSFVCEPSTLEATISNNFRMRRSNMQDVLRYSRVAYDAIGRYQTSTTSPYYNGAALGVADSIERSTSVSNRDAYGNPRLATDLNGGRVETEFGALGRQYLSYTNAGQLSYTLYAWCDGSIACPTNAVYRVKSFAAGETSAASTQPAPTSWAYFDKLGRSIVGVKESFGASQYIAASTSYDHKARQIIASEPYFVANPELSGASFTGAVNTNETKFDQFGRAWLTVTPQNVARTRSTYQVVTLNGADMMQTMVQVCPGNFIGTSNNCSVTNQQLRKEYSNALGELVAVDDINNFRLSYTHNAAGEVRKIERSGINNGSLSNITIVSEVQFDHFGRKLALIDADKGTITYQYNAADELVAQTDGKGQTQSQLYDARGRMWFRKDAKADGSCEGSSVWTFDQAQGGIGAAARETSLPGTSCDAGLAEAATTFLKRKTSTFDSLGRPHSTTTDIPAASKTWVEAGTFDRFGRPLQALDASGRATITSYTQRGLLLTLRDAQGAPNGEEYYRVLAMNERFQVTAEQRAGNANMVTTRGYEASTGRLTEIKSGTSPDNTVFNNNGAIQNESYAWDAFGNLIKRIHRTGNNPLLNRNYEETFEYDAFNRLKLVRKDGVETQAMEYNEVGNILAKAANNAGLSSPANRYDYFGNFGAAPSTMNAALCPPGTARGGPHAVAAAFGETYCYDASGNVVKNGVEAAKGGSSEYRTIEYSTFDMSTEMRKYKNGALIGAVSFKYGADRSRYMRIDASPAGAGLAADNETTFYVGNVEFLVGRNTARRSIGGVLTAYQAGTNGGLNGERVYQFMDHLGSIEVLTDQNATVTQGNSFDAWGERRQYTGVAMDQLAQMAANTSKTRRGFTGHEQVDRVNIIHMNGRIYDAKLGRFLQADPMVEDAKDSQGLNRYSYVMNNPLSLTDPSGYLASQRVRKAFGAIVQIINIVVSIIFPPYAALVAAITSYLNGYVQTGTLRGAMRAGFTNAILSMIPGGSLGGDTPSMLESVGNLAINSVKSGVIEALQGGSFGHGFRSAALGAIGMSLAQGVVGAMGGAAVKKAASGTGNDEDGGKTAAATGAESSEKKKYNPVKRRALKEGEITMLENQMGTDTPWHTFTISHGDTTGNVTAKAIGTNITFDPDGGWYMDDFSESTDYDAAQLFFHEFAHLYEYHHEIQAIVLTQIGTRFIWTKTKNLFGSKDDGYKYKLDSSKSLSNYSREQRAEIIGHYSASVYLYIKPPQGTITDYQSILKNSGFYDER